MITVLSDTHRSDDLGLVDSTRSAVTAADLVVHAGDFTEIAVIEAFERLNPSFVAVHGNADSEAVRRRLPEREVVDFDGVRIVLTHRHESGRTGLGLLGREAGADVVVSGHTHRPGIDRLGEIVLLNPGSHAQPRGNRPAFATISPDEERIRIRLFETNGSVIDEHDIDRRAERGNRRS